MPETRGFFGDASFIEGISFWMRPLAFFTTLRRFINLRQLSWCFFAVRVQTLSTRGDRSRPRRKKFVERCRGSCVAYVHAARFFPFESGLIEHYWSTGHYAVHEMAREVLGKLSAEKK